MSDVIAFPGRPTTAGHAKDTSAKLTREFEADTGYVVEVLRARLPADALDRIAGRELQAAARDVVLALYEVHDGRRRDPQYDERRRAGMLGALAEMYHGAPGDEPPEPPACA